MFEPVQADRLSARVVQQIELLMLRGLLRPGDRLPGERDLADQLGVSRPSLREALAELQARGLLVTRAGAGVYVAEVLGSAFSEGLVALLARHDEAVFDYISFRGDLEAMAAERAARVGSDTDLRVIDTVFAKMETAHAKRNPADEAELDAEFHLAIIEASHNIIMLHLMRAMFDLLRAGVFYNRQALFRQRTTRGALLEQHRAINDAIQRRDAPAARRAAQAHMDFVHEKLGDLKKAEKNEAVALLRYQHELARG